ncbi:PIN domain-containing protein [uncultured Jannaschia sp.]|uniref:PIN domain-containing protein n=1 Tax=uncultured Jannaschia sp. TaxID=293347 RepID=UPI00260865CB|nr:PIN domain-containing protein [uncultured Jannaschia sp.]
MILDTVALVRLLEGTLDAGTVADLEAAETLAVGAVSFFEINQKVRIGKLGLPAFGPDRIAAIAARGIAVLSADGTVMARAAAMTWHHNGRDHRDPFDRIVAATALERGLPVVTSDAAFADLAAAGLVLRPI